MELREALRQFLLVDRSPATRETYRKILTRFVDDIGPRRPLDMIRPDDLDAYVFTLRNQPIRYEEHPTRPAEQGNLSAATVHKRIKTIKRFFSWCVEREYLEASPARYMTNRKPVQPLGDGKAATREEVDAIIDAARGMTRNYAIVWLLAQSGVRAGEVASLQIRNLSLERNRAVVDGKGNKRRTIYYHTETADALRAWLEVRPAASHNSVFLSERTLAPLTSSAISQMLRRLCRRAGLERTLGAHSFRHYVGTTLARGHMPIPAIQEWLGHSDPQITVQYTRSLEDSDFDATAALLSPNHRGGVDHLINELNRKLLEYFRRSFEQDEQGPTEPFIS